MNFLYDKPLIIRIVEIFTALAGVVMLYIAYLNISDVLFAAITVGISVALLVCGTLLHLRKWYSWHYALALMVLAAFYLITCYAETSDLLWILLMGADLLIAASWAMKVTRQYFDAAV